MLALWPVVAWLLWSRLDAARALIWTLLAGYLLLPPAQAAFDLPVVPDMNKVSIPNLMALACALFLRRDTVPVFPLGTVGRVLMALYVISPFATVLTNGDPIIGTGAYIPGMSLYDSLAVMVSQAIDLLPFILARRYLGAPEAMRAMLVAFAVSGLAYSLPILIEARMSPQLNVWVYGFHQHDFAQTIRFGGYRPMVFLPHGLWLAFFVLMALVSATVLARRSTGAMRRRWGLAALWLMLMLVLARSAGPMVYAALALPVVLVLPLRTQFLLAGGLAVLVISYPLLRGAHLLPMHAITETAAQYSEDRAGSFAFRVDNEERLLARAQERPWFGWGAYGRNLIYDMETGEVLTISDGAWIIVLGIYGWGMYLAQFGLLVLPLLGMARRALQRRIGAELWPVAGVAVILAFNLVDLLPNATLIPLTWLMAGAVLGHLEGRFSAPSPETPREVMRRRTIL